MVLETEKAWASFVVGSEYFNLINHFKGNDSLIDAILRLKPQSVLEVGCGSGLTSVALAEKGLAVTCIDNSLDVLSNVSRLADFYNVNINTVSWNAKQLSPLPISHFDVAFSQGLLEHFSDDEIISALYRMSMAADTMIFEVPSEKWPLAPSSTLSFGDERFLSRKKWLFLIDEADLEVVHAYGWGILPKYHRLFSILPLFVGNRLKPKYANNLGFVCKKKVY